MSGVLLVIVVVIALLIAVALHRVGRGPTIFDRLVGVALAAANSVVLLLIIGVLFERLEMFVDIALAYSLLAFLFPIALAKYLDRETQERREAAATDRDGEGS